MQQSGEREFLFYEKKFKHSPSQFLSLRSLDSTELNFVYPGGISYMCRQNRFSVWSYSACEVGQVCSVKLYGFSQSQNCPYKGARQGGGEGRNVSSKKSQTLPKLTSQARLLPCPGFSLLYKLTWRISLSWPTKSWEMDVLQRPNKSY